MSEADLVRAILLEYGSRPDLRLWRANSGRGLVPTAGGGLRPVAMNVPGCPDLIGWRSVLVADLQAAGIQRVASFLGVEAKSPTGRVRPAQEAFRATLERMGCPSQYLLARSVEDVAEGLGFGYTP